MARSAIKTRPAELRPPPQDRLAAALARTLIGGRHAAAEDPQASYKMAGSFGVFLEVSECLIYAGAMALSDGDVERASRLLAVASTVEEVKDAPIPFRTPGAFALYRDCVARARETLGREEARRLRRQGRRRTRDEALAEALRGLGPENGMSEWTGRHGRSPEATVLPSPRVSVAGRQDDRRRLQAGEEPGRPQQRPR